MGAEEGHGKEARDVLSVPGDDAGLQDILAEIEARVAQRREKGIYRDLEIQDLEMERLGEEAKVIDLDPIHDLFTDPLQELSFMLQFARQFSDINTYYPIGARPGPLKPLIILVKRIIRRFMTPYMEVVFAKQREFNEKLVRSLEAIVEMIRVEREREYRGGVDRYSAWVEMGLRQSDAGLLNEAARRFEAGRQVVNLYAGEGEFLEACGREGLKALGVEDDSRLVAMCQEKLLKVQHLHPLDFLKACPVESLPGVFVEELGERGDTRELLWTVSALADKVEREGKVVLLNHHPGSFRGIEDAFRDPTVLRLVHPDTLRLVFLEAGFREVSVEAVDSREPGAGGARAKDSGIPEGEAAAALAEALSTPRFYLLEAGR
jgi:hypothetical protein